MYLNVPQTAVILFRPEFDKTCFRFYFSILEEQTTSPKITAMISIPFDRTWKAKHFCSLEMLIQKAWFDIKWEKWGLQFKLPAPNEPFARIWLSTVQYTCYLHAFYIPDNCYMFIYTSHV